LARAGNVGRVKSARRGFPAPGADLPGTAGVDDDPGSADDAGARSDTGRRLGRTRTARVQEQDDRTTPSRERTPLFGLWSTAAIALALVVPFAFATLTGSEPYPAVIFPGGGSISTHLDGQI